MIYNLPIWVVSGILFLLVFAVSEAGFPFGRRQPEKESDRAHAMITAITVTWPGLGSTSS
jgi:hypothetical protein